MIAAWNDAAEVSVQTSDLPMLYTHGLSQLGHLCSGALKGIRRPLAAYNVVGIDLPGRE